MGRKLLLTALVAVALAAGLVAAIPATEAREAVSCPWAIQQYSIAQASYAACASVYGPTPPNDSSHPCWSQFQTMWHFRRLVTTSCQIAQQ